jgi:hypothetical protein
MLTDEALSLKALSIALDRLQTLPDEQTKLLNEAFKQLRLIVCQCSPLLEFYNEEFDQLQENQDSTPRNKFINLLPQSDIQRDSEKILTKHSTELTHAVQRRRLFRKQGVLVIEAGESSEFDINKFISEMREERIQSQIKEIGL